MKDGNMNPSQLKNLVWELDGGVGVLTLNRPDQLNALDDATLSELLDVVIHATFDDEVRALLITGAGRGFCAGADVKEWSAGESNKEPWPPKMHGIMSKLYWMPKPVVAAVNGVAVGAGCDLTLVCDMRFASTQARFG